MTEAELKRWRDVNFPERSDAGGELTDAGGESRELKIKNETMKRLVSYLTRNAYDPVTIGRRVVLVEWSLEEENSIQSLKQKDLAQKLGVTEGRVSQMLSVVEDELTKIRGDEP